MKKKKKSAPIRRNPSAPIIAALHQTILLGENLGNGNVTSMWPNTSRRVPLRRLYLFTDPETLVTWQQALTPSAAKRGPGRLLGIERCPAMPVSQLD